jgi:prepilin-type N-terminal cleavage/methylation domain-containing protein
MQPEGRDMLANRRVVSSRRGFTFAEILSVIAILAVLSAVLFPIFTKAKLEAKVTSAGQRLRQLHLLLTLYRSDQESNTDYGYPWEMGLPWGINFNVNANGQLVPVQQKIEDRSPIEFEIFRKIEVDFRKRSPCGHHEELIAWCLGWDYLPTNWIKWKPDSEKYQDRQIVFSDFNCNLPGTKFLEQFATKRAIGISIAGTLVDRTKADQQVFTQEFYL